MTTIRTGERIGGNLTWKSKGEALYLDRVRHLLWAWLPKPGSGDTIGIQISGNETELGDYDGNTRGLFCIQIAEAQQKAIEKSESRELFFAPPISLGGVNGSKTTSIRDSNVYDYINSEHANLVVLRRLAWYASKEYEDVEQVGMDTWVKNVQWNDLSSPIPEIERDSTFFSLLKKTIETRRLVLLLGGLETGITTFLDQFKHVLVKQPQGANCLAVDFREEYFEDFLEKVKNGGHLLKGIQPIDPHTAALFLSLAYSAYQEIVIAPDTATERLDAFIRSDPEALPSRFIVKYLSPLASGESKRYNCHFEYFLSFLAAMMEASGRQGTLTVLLSFPGLFSWLKQHRNVQPATTLLENLWLDLQAFANANFEIDTGELKTRSSLNSIQPTVGIVIELQRLPLAGIGAAFCRQSVLAVPPLNEAEIGRVWDQRIGGEMTEDIAKSLREETGGHPWFLGLLLDCMLTELSGHTEIGNEEYSRALSHALNKATELIIMNGQHKDATKEISEKVVRYLYKLGRVLTPATRTDYDVLMKLRDAAAKVVNLTKSSLIEEWFESGLFWPRPIPGTSTLQCLSKYPNFMTHQQGRLTSLVIKQMMPEA